MEKIKKIIIPAIVLAAFILFMDSLKFFNKFPDNAALEFFCQVAMGFGSTFLTTLWVRQKFFSGSSTFKEAFSTTIIIGIFATVLAGVTAYIFFKCNENILHAFVQDSIQKAKQKLLDTQGSVPAGFDEQVRKYGYNPELQAVGQLGQLFFFVIYSLISAAILKNKKQDGENVS